MNINMIETGMLVENCYVLTKDGQALVIDPGDDFLEIQSAYQGKKVLGILITHHHFDHVGALEQVKKDTNAKVFAYENLEEKQYQMGPFTFEVVFTKGHSKDSVTYYFKEYDCMFVGDFLFQNSIGRMDLEGGSESDMRKSLELIKKFPQDTILYPGHGPMTTLKQERKYNPFLQ